MTCASHFEAVSMVPGAQEFSQYGSACAQSCSSLGAVTPLMLSKSRIERRIRRVCKFL